jgi:uncharacterized protein with FMN-binding domain
MTPRRYALLLGTALASALVAPLSAFAQPRYRDGTYVGPTYSAYYGYVQAEAMIHGGRIVEVRVLRYPSDRITSRRIAERSLPYLEREVIRAQSGRIYGVSGATLTSRAFINSIDGALRRAVY